MRRLKAIQQVLTSHTPDTIPLALECWGSFPLGLMSLGKGSWLFTRRFCPTWCVDNAVLEEGQWGNGNYCWGWLIWAFKGWLIWAGWLIFCANTQAYLEQWQLSMATIVCIWKLIASSLMGLFGSLSDKKSLKFKKKKRSILTDMGHCKMFISLTALIPDMDTFFTDGVVSVWPLSGT